MPKTTARKATKKAPQTHPEDEYLAMLNDEVTPEEMIEEIQGDIDGYDEPTWDSPIQELIVIRRLRAAIEFIRQHAGKVVRK